MSLGARPEELRARALEKLDAGDQDAERILSCALLSVDRDAGHWAGSRGDMRAHRVWLGVEARDLGLVRMRPSLHDLLTAAVARALTEDPEQTLQELALYWGLDEAPAELDYRSPDRVEASPDDPAALARAARAFLAALGEPELARALGGAELSVERAASGLLLVARLPRGAAGFERGSRGLGLLEETAGALLSGKARAPVRLRVERA